MGPRRSLRAVDPLWAVPAVLLVMSAAPVAYLLRELAGEVRSLRGELHRAAGVRDAVAALRADVERRPPSERGDTRR